MRVAAVARVERAEPIDQAATNGPLRNLVRGVPPSSIAHRRQRESVDRIAPAVPQDGVHLHEIVGTRPRAVVVRELDRRDDVAAAETRRGREESARVALAADLEARQRAVEHVCVAHVRRTGRREVALLGLGRTLDRHLRQRHGRQMAGRLSPRDCVAHQLR